MSNITGYSGRNIPFYGLPSSKVVSGAPTVDEALELADLNWNVSLQPVHQLRANGEFHVVQDKFLTVRDDTEDVLGTVGRNYRTFQNAEAFAFADELLGYGVEFDAAGHYDQSRKIFLTAKLPNGITVEGTDDSLDLFLLFKTSHDGSSAITAMITPIRLACTNMMNLASKKMVSKFTCRHTATATDRVAEAARTLRIVDQYKQEFEAASAQLLATEVDLAGFEKLLKELEVAPRLQAGMLNCWNESPTVDRKTGWGAVNAVGEYLEHLRGGRGDAESRFESNLTGQTSTIRSRAAELLLTR